MSIQSLVSTAQRQHQLTTAQIRDLNSLMMQTHLTDSDHQAIEWLTSAVLDGQVKVLVEPSQSVHQETGETIEAI